MKTSDIKAGWFYRNRGVGRTIRKVLAIGFDVSFQWFGNRPAPIEPGVRYESQFGVEHTIALSSFAKWAGSEVTDE